MLKNYLSAITIAIMIALFSSACTTVKEIHAPAEEIKINQAEYDLGKALLTAFVKNDAKTFIGLLPEETRESFTVETFAKSRKSITDSVGEPIAFHYLTTLELTSLNPQIWKVKFQRTNLENTKVFTSELLFRVVTGMTKDNEAVVTAFQFL
ncbi:MAG: hypothetical protein IJW31_01390 [Lentisphaeria bacterium]|nr:hypothetical protein [Lentisphaeria bacterium]